MAVERAATQGAGAHPMLTEHTGMNAVDIGAATLFGERQIGSSVAHQHAGASAVGEHPIHAQQGTVRVPVPMGRA